MLMKDSSPLGPGTTESCSHLTISSIPSPRFHLRYLKVDKLQLEPVYFYYRLNEQSETIKLKYILYILRWNYVNLAKLYVTQSLQISWACMERSTCRIYCCLCVDHQDLW